MSALAPTEGGGLRERPLCLDDLTACRRLSDEAGWNQIDADWRFILSHAGTRGIERDGRLVASAAVVGYGGRIGWVCMVLVTATARRQGHATRLMEWAVAHAHGRGLIAGLDATPAGRTVYRQMGFSDLYPVSRLHRARPGRVAVHPGGVLPMSPDDLRAVAAYDQTRFGADRADLLAAVRARMPHAAFLVRGADGQIEGFGLARDGAGAAQIGPLVADTEGHAVRLVQAVVAACDGSLLCDVPDRHAHLHTALATLGFTVQRAFTRMIHGVPAPFDRPECIFALAGPEFG